MSGNIAQGLSTDQARVFGAKTEVWYVEFSPKMCFLSVSGYMQGYQCSLFTEIIKSTDLKSKSTDWFVKVVG